MIEISNYLDDGANWQAQAVLAYLRHHSSFIGEKYKKDCDALVGRFENCREQGYVIKVRYNYEVVMQYAFFEHRNSDQIVVFKSNAFSIDTPSVDKIYGERGKYDYDKSFKFGQIVECGDWLIDDINLEIEKYVEKKSTNI